MSPFFSSLIYGRELNHCENDVARRDVLFWWGLGAPKLLAFSSGRGKGVEADTKSSPLVPAGPSSLPGLNTETGSQRMVPETFIPFIFDRMKFYRRW